MSSTAGAKVIKEELQRSPTNSTCYATPGEASGETSALAGRRTGATSTETFFWCVVPPCTAPGNGNCVLFMRGMGTTRKCHIPWSASP